MAYNIAPGSEVFTADGAVGKSGKPIRVHNVHIISGATAGVVELVNGTSGSDTTFLELNGVANDGATFNFANGVLFPEGCYYDEDANVTTTVITYNVEA